MSNIIPFSTRKLTPKELNRKLINEISFIDFEDKYIKEKRSNFSKQCQVKQLEFLVSE